MEQILSRENRLVKEFVRLSGDKRYRLSTGLFVLESLKLVREALCVKDMVETVLVTQKCYERLNSEMLEVINQVRCVLISESVCEKLSDQNTPQGIFAICRRPVTPPLSLSGGRWLMAVSLQDTGNLGTILRGAEALGLSGVIAAGDCPDLFSPKMIRSSMGTVFRLPVFALPDPYAVLEQFHRAGYQSYAAVVSADAEPLSGVSFPEKSVLLIGNEGNGLPEALSALCSHRVTIPMKGNAESLNAAMAACIFMWEVTK